MPEQLLIVRTLVELAESLVEELDLVDLLRMCRESGAWERAGGRSFVIYMLFHVNRSNAERPSALSTRVSRHVLGLLCDRCVEALDVAAAGVMLAAPSGALGLVTASSEAMHILELFQLQTDEGPCVEAYRTGTAVVNVDFAELAERSPRFAGKAAGEGFLSAHSLPMRTRGRTLGALSLLRRDASRLDEVELDAAQALADIATIAIVQHQVVVDAQTLNNQLAGALETRVVIEQVKGKIGQAADISMEVAFQRLRNHARNHNLRLTDLAAKIAGGDTDPLSLDELPSPAG